MAYTFDGINKLIILDSPDLSVQDMYSRWVDWLAVGVNSQFSLAMRFVGGDPISEVKNLGITYFMTNNWRIRPMEADHRLTVLGNLWTDPSGFSPFVNTLGSFNVMIELSVSSLVDSTVAQLPEIQQSMYQNCVTIDPINGADGTLYPIGTPRYPVKTLADAKVIAVARGLKELAVVGTLNVGSTESISNFTVRGEGVENSFVVLTAGCTTSKTTFKELTVSGRQSGETHYHDCEIGELTNVHCEFLRCRLIGPMSMHPTYADTTVLFQCYTGDAGGAEFVLDMNDSPCHVSFNDFHGKMRIANLNKSTAGVITVNMDAGKITLDAGCTTGVAKFRGNGELINLSNGTVVDNDLASELFKQTIQTELTRINSLPTSAEMVTLIQDNSVGANGGLTVNQATMLLEMYSILGLDPTKPLVVAQTARSAGPEILQSISTVNNVTTVTRLP